MSVINCWDNIVGITREPDACVDHGYVPVNYDLSLSGLYLDELQGINLELVYGVDEDIWDLIDRAYQNAVRTFKMDVMGAILQTHKQKYDTFHGNIGSQRYKNNLNITYPFAGVRMYCNDVKAASFKLSAIGVIMNQTDSFNIEIYNNLETDALYIIPVTSVANKYTVTSLTNIIELPLSDANWDNLEYYFIYTRGTKQPKDNQTTCGCGGVTWCFNRVTPCFADAKATKDRWRQFAMIGGISGNDIEDRETWGVSSYMNGLVLIGDFTCDKFIYLCNEDSDFETNEVDIGIAFALQYKWGEFVMNSFIDTNEVSKFSTLGLEAINNNRIYYNNKYVEMINFVAENIDVGKYGCLQCKPVHGAKMSRQLL